MDKANRLEIGEIQAGLDQRRKRSQKVMGEKRFEAGENTESMGPSEASINARFESLKTKIKVKDGVRNDLIDLQTSGVPKDEMLNWLAVTTLDGPRAELLDHMRDRKDDLESLSMRLKSLGADLAEALRDPEMKVSWWASEIAYFGNLGMPDPKTWEEDPAVKLLPDSVKILAKFFDDEAKKFGHFLRKFGRSDSQVKVALLLVFVFLKQRSKNRQIRTPTMLDRVARLLTDAIEVEGVDKYGRKVAASSDESAMYNKDALEKVWSKTGRRLLGAWLTFNRPAPKSIPASVEPDGLIPKIGSIRSR
jgi:hypothetical protein